MPSRPTLRPYRTPPRAYGPSQGEFLNVDLDIAASTDLTPLLKALDSKSLVLFAKISPRRSFIMAEVNGQPKSASAAILKFAKILAGLRGEPRKLWRSCSCRCFNIGYKAPSRYPALCDVISLEAVRAAIAVDAQIAITMYPPEDAIGVRGRLKRVD